MSMGRGFNIKWEMKFLDQTKLHDPEKGVAGNCFATCLAMITGFPIEFVPQFEEMMKGPDYMIEVQSWLRMYGYYIEKLTTGPQGYSIATGPSKRFKDTEHCVIAHDGIICHDPHPSRDGLDEILYFERLGWLPHHPVNIARRKREAAAS